MIIAIQRVIIFYIPNLAIQRIMIFDIPNHADAIAYILVR